MSEQDIAGAAKLHQMFLLLKESVASALFLPLFMDIMSKYHNMRISQWQTTSYVL